MAELKTKENNSNVKDFLNKISDKKKKDDAFKLLEIFKETTKYEPKMWGESIIGFGKYHYKSSRSSQEGDWLLCGFSPRKQAISIYIMSGFSDFKELLKDLGKYKLSSGSCIYVKKLDDINIVVLKKLIKESCKQVLKNNKKSN